MIFSLLPFLVPFFLLYFYVALQTELVNRSGDNCPPFLPFDFRAVACNSSPLGKMFVVNFWQISFVRFINFTF